MARTPVTTIAETTPVVLEVCIPCDQLAGDQMLTKHSDVRRRSDGPLTESQVVDREYHVFYSLHP
jgi:hypothetical protein